MTCASCGRETTGTWSEGGHRWGLCGDCFTATLPGASDREPHDSRDVSTEDPFEFSETRQGEDARYNWARHYDELDGAPEGDWDR